MSDRLVVRQAGEGYVLELQNFRPDVDLAEVVTPAAGGQFDDFRVVGRDDGRDEPA